MQIRIILVVLSLFSITAFCSVAIEETVVSEKERAEGYACKSSDKHVGFMKDGEARMNFNPNVCASVRCIKGVVEFHSCALQTGPPGCKAVQNVSKKYPECCRKIVC